MGKLIFIIDSLIYTASLIGIFYLQLCIPFVVLSYIISVLIVLFSFFMILPMITNMIIGGISGFFIILLGGEKEVETPIRTILGFYYTSMLSTLVLIWVLCPIYNLQNIIICVSSTILSSMVWGIKINGFIDMHKSAQQ